MIKQTVAALTFVIATSGGAMAQDAKAFVGTWTGKTQTGATIQLDIPAGIAQGQPATYYFNGQQQAPQTPVMMGNQIRLNNPSATYIVIGPPKGKSMPYMWTDGQRQAQATLTKR